MTSYSSGNVLTWNGDHTVWINPNSEIPICTFSRLDTKFEKRVKLYINSLNQRYDLVSDLPTEDKLIYEFLTQMDLDLLRNSQVFLPRFKERLIFYEIK